MNTCQVSSNHSENADELLVVAPKPNAQIHISNINLGQHLTSTR